MSRRAYFEQKDGSFTYKGARIKPASGLYWEVDMPIEGGNVNEVVPFFEGALDVVDNIAGLANA